MLHASCTMKGFLISLGVFTLIIGVDSLIPVKETMPYDDTFPALILKTSLSSLLSGDKTALPHEIRKENDIKMLMFESLDKKIKKINNFSLSYKCPAETNSKILVKNQTKDENKKKRCKDELRVSVLPNDTECGNYNRKEYDIGYGITTETESGLFSGWNQPGEKTPPKVEHWLYTSCFDNDEKRAYAAKYELRKRNDLYQISNQIYPKTVQEKILQLHSNFLEKMAKKVQLEKNGSKVIPFQLVSHEDMILYNWKVATFNEKNYNFIWSNVAENSWRITNFLLRHFMTMSNFDLEVFSGVHDYTDGGYPRYIWKYIQKGTKGIAVVIHNQHINDTEDYPKLCQEPKNNCDLYGVFRNETNKNNGYLYCCPTDSLKTIQFFKNKFSSFKVLEFRDLSSADQEYHPPAYDVSSGSVGSSSRLSPRELKSPSSSPTTDIYVSTATPYKSLHKPKVSIPSPTSPSIFKFNESSDDEAVRKLRKSLQNINTTYTT